jgi:heme-degrading monooxygenase HmoA
VAAVCSFWDDQHAIDRLAHSRTYQATVARLQSTGLLTGTPRVEVFEVESGALEVLAGVERF